MTTQKTASQSPLIDLFVAIKARWYLILLCTLVAGAMGTGWSALQTPMFESTVTVLIEREHQPPIQNVGSSIPDLSPDYYETHFELLKTYRVLEKAAHQLHLLERPEYTAPPGLLEKTIADLQSKIMRQLEQVGISLPPGSSSASGTGQARDPWEVGLARFEQQINIKPVRGTRLARITAKSHNPLFAAEAANAIASAYVQVNEEVYAKNKSRALDWFSSHLADLRKKVEEAQDTLHAYRAKHGVVEVGDHQTLSGQRLRELTSELVKLEIQRSEAESRYGQIATLLTDKTISEGIDWSKWDDHAEVLSSPLIQTLRTEEIKSSGEVAELTEKYGPLHPKMLRAKTELQQLRERLIAEVSKIYRSLKHERDLVVSREAAIRAAIKQQKSDVVQLESYQSEQGILEREVKSAQQVYETFLTGLKETSLVSEFIASNVVIADLARPASSPSKPRIVANIILGLLIGLIFGTGLVLVVDHRDQSFKAPEDLVDHLLPGRAFLEVIPFMRRFAGRESLIIRGPQALPALEALRSIRASVLHSGMIQRDGTLVITSPGPSEGKSTVAVNLAMAMAQLEGARVLLIDADLRNANRPNLLALRNRQPKGLVHYLGGEAEFEEILHQNGEPNLRMIPPGKIPVNPSELLSSTRMRMLLARCRAEGYFVILDTPPVGLFSDAAILGSQVDAVVMVVGAGQSDQKMYQFAVQKIMKAGGTLIGIVLQKAATSPLFRNYHYGQAEHTENTSSHE